MYPLNVIWFLVKFVVSWSIVISTQGLPTWITWLGILPVGPLVQVSCFNGECINSCFPFIYAIETCFTNRYAPFVFHSFTGNHKIRLLISLNNILLLVLILNLHFLLHVIPLRVFWTPPLHIESFLYRVSLFIRRERLVTRLVKLTHRFLKTRKGCIHWYTLYIQQIYNRNMGQ